MTTRGQVAGSQRTTIENLRDANAGLMAQLVGAQNSAQDWQDRCLAMQTERDALREENARLRDIISPGDAAAYEEGMAALQARVRGLQAVLAEIEAATRDIPEQNCTLANRIARVALADVRLLAWQPLYCGECGKPGECGCLGNWMERAEATAAEVERLRAAGRRCMEISASFAAAGIVGHVQVLDVMESALAPEVK